MLVGRATRLLPYLPGEPKVYEAHLRFGTATDTDDLLGEVVTSAPLPTRAAIDAAIPAFTGRIEQVPSTYSAKRVEGQRAYDLARKGVAVQLAPVSMPTDELIVITKSMVSSQSANFPPFANSQSDEAAASRLIDG